MPGRLSFGNYLQAAFFNRWNMLFFAGAIVASFICPLPDVGLLLTAAGEIGFLAFCSTNERFQRAVDSLQVRPEHEDHVPLPIHASYFSLEPQLACGATCQRNWA